MLQTLTSRTFSEQLNTTFRMLLSEAEPVALELIAVTERNDAPQIEYFSLVFRGPQAPVYRQGTHRFEHATLGTLDMFLSPIGPAQDGMRYEAVFSRMR
jgi:hypothetical protein